MKKYSKLKITLFVFLQNSYYFFSTVATRKKKATIISVASTMHQL